MTPPTAARRSSAKKKKAGAAAAAAPRPFVAHNLVPPHELLSEEEGRKIVEQLRTPIDRLPKIFVVDPGLKTDPKFVAAREAREPLDGRLVRIRRPSQTAGEAVAYRVIRDRMSPAGD